MPIITGNSPDEPTPVGPGVLSASQSTSRGRSTAKLGEKTFTETVGKATPDQLREWQDIQIPYENLAGTDESLDSRALSFVNEHINRFQGKCQNIYEKWAIINQFVRGSAYITRGAEKDVHVPAMQKALERMIPRIEEQILQQDPWFTVVGREEMDQREQNKIRSYLEYQMDQCRFREEVQPAIRTMLIYGFCVFKVWWCIEEELRIKREYKQVTQNGTTKTKVKLTEENEVVYNGPKIKLVDPFDFIIDTDATCINDAKYVGEVTKMTFEEIAMLGEQGIYKNWEKLREMHPRTRYDYANYEKQVRKLHFWDDSHGTTPPSGGQKEFYVATFCAKFDLFNTGIARECIITTANNSVVLQVQENPFDDKHRMYALARANRDAFEFFSSAPFDHSIRINMEMDRHRQLVMKGHARHLCPILLTPDTDDLPDSLWDVEAGSILNVANPQAVHEVNIKSTVGEYRYLENILDGDIEESSGSTRMLGGTEDSGTATESTHKLAESSRRLRSYVRSFTHMAEDILRQFHAMNRQYVTQNMTFRVIGKSAHNVKTYDTVSPQLFQTDVDFEFRALSNLHSSDLRATQMLQWLNTTAPIAAKHPGRIDDLAILGLLWDDMVGSVPSKDVINTPTKLEDLPTQEEENIMILQGQDIEVDPLDDDREHLEELLEIREKAQEDEKIYVRWMQHYESHRIQLKRKAQAKKAVENQSQSVMPGENPLDPHRGTTGNQKGLGEGDVRNKPGSIFDNPAVTPPGETPGAPSSARVPAADRQQGFFQTQNAVGAGS